MERLADTGIGGWVFGSNNGGLARLYAQGLKKREKKEEKVSKNVEKLQEITKKREKERKVGHFCRNLKISEKKHARLMLCG